MHIAPLVFLKTPATERTEVRLYWSGTCGDKLCHTSTDRLIKALSLLAAYHLMCASLQCMTKLEVPELTGEWLLVRFACLQRSSLRVSSSSQSQAQILKVGSAIGFGDLLHKNETVPLL